MNDDQLEAAARKLCKIRGIDPDRSIGHCAPPNADGMVPAVMLRSPAWRVAASEILSFYQVAKALDTVFGDDLK